MGGWGRGGVGVLIKGMDRRGCVSVGVEDGTVFRSSSLISKGRLRERREGK